MSLSANYFVMQTTIETLPKSQVKITIELSPEEMKPHLEKAAEDLSKEFKIEGFRPGKASLGIVTQRFGAQHVWEQAGEQAVRKAFIQAIREKNILTVGRPNIQMVKLAPDNPFIFTAEVAVLPEVKLGDYQSFKAKKDKAEIKPAEVDKAIEELRGMFATEAMVDRSAAMGDKVEIDFDIMMNNVPLEGGSSKQHPMVLGSKNFIPGFEEQLVGMKKDDTKNFSLAFPTEYFKKDIAGKTGDFKVAVKSVFEVKKPELNDEFAKKAGKFTTIDELRNKLEQNLLAEAEDGHDAVWERAIMDELIERSDFGQLPEVLVQSELEKMVNEIRESIEHRGGKFEDYLASLKKSVEDLQKEFLPTAEKRVKAALAIRHIAKQEKLEADPKQVEEEVKSTLNMYADKPEILARIDSEDYRDYLKTMQVNKQVVELLKSRATVS